jgi:4-hydroxybenzoate polyprenyltransferase
MRPAHWIKNVFVLAPLVFAQRLDDREAVLRALAAFCLFCLVSSAVYVANDLADRRVDRLHPRKRNRPIAAGELSPGAAATLAVLLAATGLAAGLNLGIGFTGILAGYLVLNLAYSLGLKNIVILDVMLVACGFLLRAWGGAAVVSVGMSNWLILCTGLISLFLGFVKRRQELDGLADLPPAQRPILAEYTVGFLDQMIGVVTASTVLAYAFYAFSPQVGAKLGTPYMGTTLPFVMYGIFRYLYLVHRRGEGESPTGLVLRDGPLRTVILLWGVVVLVLLFA